MLKCWYSKIVLPANRWIYYAEMLCLPKDGGRLPDRHIRWLFTIGTVRTHMGPMNVALGYIGRDRLWLSGWWLVAELTNWCRVCFCPDWLYFSFCNFISWTSEPLLAQPPDRGVTREGVVEVERLLGIYHSWCCSLCCSTPGGVNTINEAT